MPLQYVLFFIIVFFVFYQLLQRKMRLLDGMAFLLPFSIFTVDIGVQLTSNQLYLFLLAMLIILKIFTTGKVGKYGNRLPMLAYIYLIYLCVDTYIVSTTAIEYDTVTGKGYFRNEGRFITQTILAVFSYFALIVIPDYISGLNDILRIFRYLLAGAVLLAVVGLFQEFVFVIAGSDIFPSPNASGEYSKSAGVYNFFPVPLIRIGSLAGEPKRLAQTLVITFFIVLIYRRCGFSVLKKTLVWQVMFIAVIILSQSTSGYVLWGILYVVSMSLFLFLQIKTKIRISSMFLVIILLGTGFYYQDTIDTIYTNRIESRDIANEDFDAVIKDFLQDNPEWLLFGSGVGNIHHLAAPYISDEYAHYMENNIFVAKSGYLRQISELGVIGFCLFIGWNLLIFIRIYGLYLYFKRDPQIAALLIIGISLFIAYLARVYIIDVYFFGLALCNSAIIILERKRKQIKTGKTVEVKYASA